MVQQKPSFSETDVQTLVELAHVLRGASRMRRRLVRLVAFLFGLAAAADVLLHLYAQLGNTLLHHTPPGPGLGGD